MYLKSMLNPRRETQERNYSMIPLYEVLSTVKLIATEGKTAGARD